MRAIDRKPSPTAATFLRVAALLLLADPVGTWMGRTTAHAQDLEPRSYTNTPVGLNFVIAGYVYQEGDVATDASLPLDDAEVQIHSTLLAYARSFGVLGKSAKIDAILPYSWASGSATFQGERHERDVGGLADARFRASVNFYGAPALSLEEFASYEQDVIIGATLQVTAPLGQYDDDKILNIGSNRWAFKPEIGISKAFGPLILELAPSVTFYTDNDDFLGGTTREQDPLYGVQGHVIYRFGEAFWGAVDGTYYGGGRTTIEGKENDDRKSNARVGLTLSLSVTRRHSIKLYASKAVATRAGGDFGLIGMAAQYRWGGGL